ncbi:MAG: hypothetical protein JNN12_06215 [Bacteroidetes Order II. Incertae sedis bacterium]|nr:hypothetical protein [Bacteroidetes Order II. bacterium]
MKTTIPEHLTTLLNSIESPEADEWNEVLVRVWHHLEKIAQNLLGKENGALGFNSKELISEAWLRIGYNQPLKWENRRHFYNTMGQLMRQVLINHAAKKNAARRIPPHLLTDYETVGEIALTEKIEALANLDEALEYLKREDERACEVFIQRYFIGLKIKEISTLHDVTDRTVLRDLEYARAWLKAELLK